MRIIPKPENGEYPEYANMYIKLLPDDGLILKRLQDNFEAVKNFVYELPLEKLFFSLTTSAFFPIAQWHLHGAKNNLCRI